MVDLAPNFAGLLHGIADTIYSAMGFVIPMIASAIISKDPYDEKSWIPLWYLTAGATLSGLLCYSLLGTSEEQKWNKLREDEKPLTDNDHLSINN